MREKFQLLMVITMVSAMIACGVPRQRITSDLRSCQTERVKDGDSVLAVCEGEVVELRLACVDAPETSQKRYGLSSKMALQAAIGDRFDARFEGQDRYGRIIATLWHTERDLNLALVAAGHVVVYQKYCDNARYLQAESTAKHAKLGVWDGELRFVMPWEWRRR